MTQENTLPLEDTAGGAQSIAIEREAHDVSRFEWRVAVPLPAQEPFEVHRSDGIRASVIGTLLVLVIGLPLPWVPFGQILGFVHLPAIYFLWAVFVVAAYLLTVQRVKRLYRRRIGELAGHKLMRLKARPTASPIV